MDDASSKRRLSSSRQPSKESGSKAGRQSRAQAAGHSAPTGYERAGSAPKKNNPRLNSASISTSTSRESKASDTGKAKAGKDGPVRTGASPSSPSREGSDGRESAHETGARRESPRRDKRAATAAGTRAARSHARAPEARGGRQRRRKAPLLPIVAFVALAVVGIVAAGMNSGPRVEAVLDISGNSPAIQSDQSNPDGATDGQALSVEESAAAEGSTASDAAPSEASAESATAQQLDLSAIPSSAEVSTFSATGQAAPSVPQESLEPVDDALAAFGESGIDVGFVFMNLGNGEGVSANADQKVYGASSIKGPFVTYVCEELVDGGSITTDTSCKAYNENFAANGSASVDSLITNTVEQSSNGSFASLRKAYGGSDYAAWLQSLGVDPDIHEGGDWFAWYTPRDAAKLWTEAYEYFESGTETSKWLHELMGSTNVSYIRDSVGALKAKLEDQEWEMPAPQSSAAKTIKTTADSVSGYKDLATILDGATVVNKAGWCASDAESGDRYDSTSDNGIVTIDGNDYLLCIMTGAPYSERNAGRVTDLAAAALALYDDLA